MGRVCRRKREKARARVACLEKRHKKHTKKKKQKNHREQRRKREKKTGRQIAPGQLRSVLLPSFAFAVFFFFFFCRHFPLFPALHQRCLCCDVYAVTCCNCDCSCARVGGNYAMPTLRPCHRTSSWPCGAQTGPQPKLFQAQNACSFSACTTPLSLAV